jgi:hypothetical protein
VPEPLVPPVAPVPAPPAPRVLSEPQAADSATLAPMAVVKQTQVKILMALPLGAGTRRLL